MTIFSKCLNCGRMAFPFKYLVVSIGGNLRKVEFWRPIIHDIESRLSMWKGKLLSMVGRLCLIKSVITTLPLFYMCFFKAPKLVRKTIRKIQSKFLWGWNAEGKKIHWVAWNKVCKPHNEGGLGVKDISKFNYALLEKLKRRLGVGEKGVWRNIIKSRYGNWREIKKSMVDRKSSYWWKDLCLICEVDKESNWFDRRIKWKHGNEGKIKFWEDCWVGDRPLKDIFPRLYSILDSK